MGVFLKYPMALYRDGKLRLVADEAAEAAARAEGFRMAGEPAVCVVPPHPDDEPSVEAVPVQAEPEIPVKRGPGRPRKYPVA